MRTPNYGKVLNKLEKYYVMIPLEKFGKDPYRTLVSTVLSSRTNDDTTYPAALRLFRKAPNIKKLKKLKLKEIKKLIYPVGFYKTKAKHLKKISSILLREFDGKIPNTIERLMKLPGVGRKTANLVLARAFDKDTISVDTHVHYITNLLGWVKTKTPDQTEKELKKKVPRKYWKKINRVLVSIGRQYRSKKKLVEFLKRVSLPK